VRRAAGGCFGAEWSWRRLPGLRLATRAGLERRAGRAGARGGSGGSGWCAAQFGLRSRGSEPGV
jgi:hypothetical protein